MSESRILGFLAWGPAKERVEAFGAALHALAIPGQRHQARISMVERQSLLAGEVVVWMRNKLLSDKEASMGFFRASLLVGGETDVLLRSPVREADVCLLAVGAWDVHPARVVLADVGGSRSVAFDAAASVLHTEEDTEDLLVRLCAPDGSKRIVTGAAADDQLTDDVPPVEMCATYQANAGDLARDLALSWIFLHESAFVDPVAPLTLSELGARVEKAPPGARVYVAPDVRCVHGHIRLDLQESRRLAGKGARDPAVHRRQGPRARLPGDIELTREQVLTALATPPATLLEALEAAALPDGEWRAVEPLARAIFQATRAGAPAVEVDVSTDEHMRWIEQHAPYHVRRLPNGGVMLATHPYRVLWPLWADALALLGITKST